MANGIRLDPVYFSKCAPSIGTTISECGSVTLCSNKPVTADEMSSIYMKGTDYRVMEALLHHDFEIKQCQAVQNGLYDFLMANKVSMTRALNTRKKSGGTLEIAPFVLGRQFSPINNEYWNFTGGQANGGNWQVNASSATNIPADIRFFPVGMRVYADGKSAGGSTTHTAYKIVSATLSGDKTYVTLVMTPQNASSHLDPDKIGNPTSGMLVRGTPNVNPYESYCQDTVEILNWKDVPFWIEWTKTTFCSSEQYRKFRKVALENPLFREFQDLDDTQRNKQRALDWQKRVVNTAFFGKPLAGQNVNDYDTLEEVDAFAGDITGAGADGGTCVGKRANLVGIYEQLAECGRIADLQNGQLNLPALFVELYNMMRVRQGNNHPNPKMFDLFTDSVFAELINQAMIKYYNSKSDNTLRLNYDVNQPQKKAEFGFNFRSYALFWPPVTINIITHEYFDDYVAAAKASPAAIVGTRVWILDFSGIRPGIIDSYRQTNRYGNHDKLAALSAGYACTAKTLEKEITQTGMLWTMIVDCPLSNLILEGIDPVVPEHATLTGSYPTATTSTTTTTFAPFTG